VKAILVAGLVAGTVDIGAAALMYGLSPVDILLGIAGGLLGAASRHGGLAAAGLGLLLQWIMSIIIAALYSSATHVLSMLNRYWVLGGVACGIVVFVVMNYLVVPLSAWHRQPHFTASLFSENLTAMLLFGLIVAYYIRIASVRDRQEAATPRF
jgi:ABC-type uncharacterized transport system permease subunit